MPTKTPSKPSKKAKSGTTKAKPTARPKSSEGKGAKATRMTAKVAAPAAPKVTAPKSAAPKPAARPARPVPPAFIPRAMPIFDDDEDVLGIHGAGHGAGYGRCGGRMLGSVLEQTICDRLGQAGVAHSHSPRHFEVNLQEKQVAAYAPMIVLRGRGREGKSVVIEAAETAKNPMLPKIAAFRRQYGQEYYVILVGTDEVLDEVALATYDEACASTDVNTLIARLAE